MDGLILLVILIPLVFLILLITILNRTGEQKELLESLYDKLNQLSNEVSRLSKELKEQKEDKSVNSIFKETPTKIIVEEKLVIKTPLPPEPVETINIPTPVVDEYKEYIAAKTETKEKSTAYVPPVFKEEKPERDIEKFIGENLANKIGIAVLVLGIAFFVKYAIDKDWVNETGRVIIGLVSGGILIGLAHYFRNSYRSFSSVLVGGGLSVFYFSIAFAFHQYHLIEQTTAFILMVIITGFAVVLSLYYNRQELAILATIGGFITPFLVSTGNENYVALFTYLCILNAGLIALSWFKKWPAINIISLFFTTIIFGGWLIKRTWIEDAALFPYKEALLFAILFYLLFVLMNIINSIRLKNKFTAFDFSILLSVNSLFYTAGFVILSYWSDGDYKGLFTLMLGLFNLALTAIFYRQKNTDRNFIFLLAGLAITFISLTAPVQFRGNHIVLFWAAESVLLLVLYQRSKIVLLKKASLIVVSLMLITLVLTWVKFYFNSTESLRIIINKEFITTFVVSLALFIYQRLMKKEQEEFFIGNLTNKFIRQVSLIAAISILYLAGVLEIYYQFSRYYQSIAVHVVYLQLYTFLFTAVLFYFIKKLSDFPILKILFTTFCLALYLINVTPNYEVSFSLLTIKGGGLLFAAHWIAAIILLWLLYDVIKFFFSRKEEAWKVYTSPFTWAAAVGIILLLSIEMYHLNLWLNYKDQTDWLWWENLYYKAGLSILWSSCSFALMWLGMKYSFRTLRLISLSLFTITLVKLFLYDIRNIPPGGKIAAFILLGVLLLVVSFMYQRLKKILIDNNPTDQTKTE